MAIAVVSLCPAANKTTTCQPCSRENSSWQKLFLGVTASESMRDFIHPAPKPIYLFSSFIHHHAHLLWRVGGEQALLHCHSLLFLPMKSGFLLPQHGLQRRSEVQASSGQKPRREEWSAFPKPSGSLQTLVLADQVLPTAPPLSASRTSQRLT